MNEKIKMERPILFSTEMIQAILDGRKTQTRRIIKPQPTYSEKTGFAYGKWCCGIGSNYYESQKNFIDVKCPYGKVGNILWVRETWAIDGNITKCFLYKANYNKEINVKWKPSIHMPKVACRIKLRITDIQVQKLQVITEEDAKKEGIKIPVTPEGNYLFELSAKYPNYKYFDNEKKNYFTACYAGLWDSLNLKRGYGWSLNPFVWVISFQIIKP